MANPPSKIVKNGKLYALDESWSKGGHRSKAAAQMRASADRSRGLRATVQKVGDRYYLYTNRFL